MFTCSEDPRKLPRITSIVNPRPRQSSITLLLRSHRHTHTQARGDRTQVEAGAEARTLAEQVNLQDSSNQSAIAVYGHSARFTGNARRKVDYTQSRFRTGGT